MTLWKDSQNKIHDDMNGEALSLPSWPVGLVQITQVEAEALLAPPPPTQAEQFKAIERAFDKHIDDVAAARGYGRSGTSPVAPSEACKGFAGYPNQWQAEAIKFGQWSADCCALMIQGQADVTAGTRPMPTPEQAVAELPVMIWN